MENRGPAAAHTSPHSGSRTKDQSKDAYPSVSQVRLASYNLRKCKGTDGHRAPGRVLDVINGIEADVITLQEADLRLGPRPTALPRRMIEVHTDFVPVQLAMSSVSLGWHGNAILVRKGARIDTLKRIDLPGLEPRGAVMVETGGLRIVGVHLGLMRASRQKQLHTIKEALLHMDGIHPSRAHAQSGHPHAGNLPKPTVIMGDFNEWSPTRGLDPIRDLFDIHSPGRSFHASRPIAALDRIAVSHGLEVRDAGVIETEVSRRASDHLPIWAELRVK